jgi:thiol-disulfide isomerase/thioredoxin
LEVENIYKQKGRDGMGKYVAMGVALVFTLASIGFGDIDQLATISPQQPKIGDQISVVYDAGIKMAALIGVKDVILQALVFRSEGTPNLVEVHLKKTGKLWKGSFALTEPKAQYILIKFSSGEKTDDNNENAWDLIVYGTDGKPLKGAYLWRGQAVMNGGMYGFKKTKDADAGMVDLKKEKELYPGNASVDALIWNAELRATPGEETKAKIKKEVEDAYVAQKDNQEALAITLNWMARLGDKAKADSLRNLWIAKDPKGKLAESDRLGNKVFGQKEPEKVSTALDEFLSDFPQKPDVANNYRLQLIYRYIQAKNYDKAAELLGKQDPPNGDMYNTLAWAIIEKGEKGPEMDKAVEWARRGINIMKSGKEQKPSYMSARDWKTNTAFILGMISDTYAFGLFKSEKTKEAESAYAEAVKLTEGKQSDINERYVEACVANGNYRKAMDVASGFIQKGLLSDKLLEGYKTAYVKVKGSEKGFDDVVNKAKDASKEEARKTIMKERVNKPAVEFALKSIEGNTVKLADLRGKVVVVDFWATWCGPCKASFPFLQKMYDKYKDNPNVKIIALNTWENETGAKREDLVKKFMADNKYTFPVLYDEGFVEKYGVEGIPTKFIIDKKGKIQFKNVGFLNGQKMMDEMTLEIEMLLGDEFYSMK